MVVGCAVLLWSAILATVSAVQFPMIPARSRGDGIRLVLQVHVEDAVRRKLSQDLQQLRFDLTKLAIPYMALLLQPSWSNPATILITGVPPDRHAAFRRLTLDVLGPNFLIQSDPGRQNAFTMQLLPTAVTRLKNRALQQSIQVISNRMRQLGIAGARVQRYGQGAGEILVQLPPLNDPGRVKMIIQAVGWLQINLVMGGPYPSRQAAVAAHRGVLPPGTELIPYNTPSAGVAGVRTWYMVSQAAPVTWRDLSEADVGKDEHGHPSVHFTLTNNGAVRLARLKEANMGKKLAIILDNSVVTVSAIQSQGSGQGTISGFLTPREATDLAIVLRSGALPASISYLEESVGGSR